MMQKDDRKLIFVAYITTRKGNRVYASKYGLKAFPIWVKIRRKL